VKCLLKYKNLRYTVNGKSVSEFFAYNAVLNDRTMFDQIHRLPPGSIWTYANGTLRKKQYFDISRHVIDTTITKTEFLEEGNRIFNKIIPRYLSGNGIGVSLTGGWDTRAIVAAGNTVSGEMPCYTFRGMHRSSLDVKVARRVAKACRLPYRTVKLGKEFLDTFSKQAHKTIYISDGHADIFKSHEIFLNNIVKRSLPIRVTGKYGTQLLSGFSALKKRKLKSRIFSESFLSELQDIDQSRYLVDSSASMIDEIRWLWGGYLSIETSQLVVRTPYTDKDLVEFILKVPHEYFVNSDLQKYIIAKNSPKLAMIPSDKGQFIAESAILKKLNQRMVYLLMKMDKAYNWHAMPHLLTRLEPLWGQSWLQHMILGHNQFINYRLWLRNELQEFAKEILMDESTLSRPYFDRKFLMQMVRDHFNGRANYTNEIGAILSFEIWHRLFVD
jgi:asparagine synthase (glutamine-hydrolysing)